MDPASEIPELDSMQDLETPKGTGTIARPQRLADAIAERLRGMILDGTIEPGTILRQEDLANQLGVSRTPLRGALIRLEQDGLIEFAASGAASVVDLDPRDSFELIEMREIIDGLAARKAAEKGIGAAVIAVLEAQISKMEGALATGDMASYLRANTTFHLELVNATEHRQLIRNSALIRMASQAIYLGAGEADMSRMAGAVTEHREILRAVTEGDAEEAESLARQHIRSAGRHWIQASEGKPLPGQTNSGDPQPALPSGVKSEPTPKVDPDS